jgi:tetratricopeptide (TPR) repeat protein
VKKVKNLEFSLAGAIALATFLVYLAALRNDFVNWDDGSYVFENPHIRSLGSAFLKWAFFDFYEANWHPLTWLSHALDYALWGLNPLGHHLTNIVLHAINAFIVVFLVIRLLEAWKERAAPNGPPSFLNGRAILIAAGTTGLLFGLHPVHVESVAWVAERKDLLCALFFLLSVLRYVKYAKDTDGPVHRSGLSQLFNTRYLSALGLFVLALMSKPMAVTLPVVLLVLDWFPFNRIRSGRTLWAACVEKLPFFALSLASSIVTILAQRAGGAMGGLEFVPLSTRALVGAKALVAYLWKMLAPVDLIPFYPYPENVSLLSWKYLFLLVLVIAVTVVCIRAARKRKLLLSAWIYYVVTLIPVLGIVQVGSQSMADRYTYLPSLGPFLLLGLTAAWISSKVNYVLAGTFIVKIAAGAAAMLVLGGMSYLTLQQIGVWKNSIVLWNSVIAKEPQRAYLAYVNRGRAFETSGQPDRALADYDTAIALKPDYYEAYVNRGVLRGETGMFDKAMEDFNRSIALDADNPEAYSNRGIVYALTGQYDTALKDFNTALTLNGDLAEAYFNRGRIYSKEGRTELARADYQKACDLQYEKGCNALRER